MSKLNSTDRLQNHSSESECMLDYHLYAESNMDSHLVFQ